MSLHQAGDAPVVDYYLTDPTTVPATPVNATVTATLTSPTGSTVSLTVVNVGTGHYRVIPTLATAGDWAVTWTASGTGIADTEVVRLYALDPATDAVARPVWAPTLADVAVHIPTRTRAVGVDDTYLLTFTDDTTPTGDEASRILGHACTWVTGLVGIPVMSAAYQQCGVAASLWAAYWIEVAYPERDADLSVYDRLRVDAQAATDTAAALNRAAGGGATVDPSPGDSLLPSNTFPAAPSWADPLPGAYW